MASLSSWMKKAFDSLVDPEKDQRVHVLVQTLEQQLARLRGNFVLEQVIAGLDYRAADLETAKEIVYRKLLERGWKDGTLTEGERQVAAWAAARLQLAADKTQEVNLEFARRQFAVSLARALDDGVLDIDEERDLQQIAASVNSTVPEFARRYFLNESESFLRGLFSSSVSSGNFSPGQWEQFLTLAAKLGLSRHELLQAIQPQARHFVEHLLADCKADGRLSETEDAGVRWLLETLILPDQFQQYVSQQLTLLRQLTAIDDGKLPSVPAPASLAIRAGEIVHYFGPAIWRHTRMLKNGPQSDDHQGVFALTDNRIVFSSATKSQVFSFRSITTHHGGDDWIQVQTKGKPASAFFFPERTPIRYAILRSAVQMANQTLVVQSTEKPSRYIPRDVRQRVWQKYGGRCAECSADDYLEFDHIIPVARGGSSSEANVQLLCRRCNLKKSDHI